MIFVAKLRFALLASPRSVILVKIKVSNLLVSLTTVVKINLVKTQKVFPKREDCSNFEFQTAKLSCSGARRTRTFEIRRDWPPGGNRGTRRHRRSQRTSQKRSCSIEVRRFLTKKRRFFLWILYSEMRIVQRGRNGFNKIK